MRLYFTTYCTLVYSRTIDGSNSIMSCCHTFFWWGDGTSGNDVSSYEFSGTPGSQNEPSRKHNVTALMHPRHYASTYTYGIMHPDRDVSRRDIVFLGWFVFRTGGPDSSFPDVPSPHHIYQPIFTTIFLCRLYLFIFFSSVFFYYFYLYYSTTATVCTPSGRFLYLNSFDPSDLLFGTCII